MSQTNSCDVAVIGGGASGMTAAIAAARAGASVILFEKLLRPGKKVLASGNGRCNLLNESLGPEYYNIQAAALVKSVFNQYPKDALFSFFETLGLAMVSDKGRIFPATNQSVSVLEVLEEELSGLGVQMRCGCEVAAIKPDKSGFRIMIRSQDGPFSAGAVILCGGGKSYPAFGSDGSAYALARGFGHRLVEPVPSAVPLAVKDIWCHKLQGQRIRAGVTAMSGTEKLAEADGELLFTKYGLSGSAILDVSEAVSVAMNRQRRTDVFLRIDLVPFISEEKLTQRLASRLRGGLSCEKLLIGLLPPKFSALLAPILATRDGTSIVRHLKTKRFDVASTLGWNEAEFTAGGLDISQIDPGTLESTAQKGLYFAGEILDVVGRRGGYNLAWAWASGLAAGREAYVSVKTRVF